MTDLMSSEPEKVLEGFRVSNDLALEDFGARTRTIPARHMVRGLLMTVKHTIESRTIALRV